MTMIFIFPTDVFVAKEDLPETKTSDQVQFVYYAYLILRCAILSRNKEKLARAYSVARFLPGGTGKLYEDQLQELVKGGFLIFFF